MILGNVIRNCLRQDYFYKVLFLRLIKYITGGWRVLRLIMVLPLGHTWLIPKEK